MLTSLPSPSTNVSVWSGTSSLSLLNEPSLEQSPSRPLIVPSRSKNTRNVPGSSNCNVVVHPAGARANLLTLSSVDDDAEMIRIRPPTTPATRTTMPTTSRTGLRRPDGAGAGVLADAGNGWYDIRALQVGGRSARCGRLVVP